MSVELAPTLTERSLALESTSPFLRLWQIDANAAGTNKWYLVLAREPVEFDGIVYQPAPIQISDRQETTDGGLPRATLSVSNVTLELMPTIDEQEGLIGHRVVMLTVHRDHLDDPTAKIETQFRILTTTVRKDGVVSELGTFNYLDLPVPAQRFTARCRWVFQSRECGYAGALTSCDKTLTGANGCIAHGADSANHPKRYGGFPSMGEGL